MSSAAGTAATAATQELNGNGGGGSFDEDSGVGTEVGANSNSPLSINGNCAYSTAGSDDANVMSKCFTDADVPHPPLPVFLEGVSASLSCLSPRGGGKSNFNTLMFVRRQPGRVPAGNEEAARQAFVPLKLLTLIAQRPNPALNFPALFR